MILRVNKYPQLNSKLHSAIGEWSETIEPLDLFRCPNSCYESENVSRLQDTLKGYDSEFSKLNENPFFSFWIIFLGYFSFINDFNIILGSKCLMLSSG